MWHLYSFLHKLLLQILSQARVSEEQRAFRYQANLFELYKVQTILNKDNIQLSLAITASEELKKMLQMVARGDWLTSVPN